MLGGQKMITTVNGIELYYKKTGEGEPLILLHGNTLDHSIFDELTKKLKNNFTVYAIDSRNHGKSERANDYSYEAMASDVYEFIKTLNLGKVNLLGFSDGAVIGLTLALAHLEVLNKAALLGLNLKPSDLREKSTNYYIKNYEETGNPLYKLVLESPNIKQSELKKVTIPIFLIAAEREMFRDGLFEEMLEGFPNAKGKIMEGHKHETYLVHNDLLYQDLCEFFIDFYSPLAYNDNNK